MHNARSEYSVEMIAQVGQEPREYDTAYDAMRAVNQLCALQLTGFVIRDSNGTVLTDRQLAMIVMEDRFMTSRDAPPG